jgi:dynein heavy chain
MQKEEIIGIPMVPEAKKDMEEHPMLRIPSVIVTENGSIDCDGELNLFLKAAINDWKTVVSKTIDEEQSKRPDGQGPLAEVEFWRARNLVLSKLAEQIQAPVIKAILQTLQPIHVSLIHEAETQFQKLSRLAAEAAENASLLATLENSLNKLAVGSIPTIMHCIPQLLDSLSLVWTISKHYNRVERFLPLMEKISFQLVTKVRNSVDIISLLRYPSNKAAVYEAATMLDTWHEVYKKVRKNMPDERLVQHRWDFEKFHLFGPTDYMAKVLRDLGVLIDATGEFQRFLDPKISSIIGQNEDVHVVGLKVTAIRHVLENMQFDIFDENQKDEWKSLVQSVGMMIVDIDNAIGSCIEKSFQTLKSSQAALDLVENLQILRCLENHCRIERRFTQILDLYSRELSNIEEVFQRSKLSPPMSKTLPQSASCIAWSLRLYQRAKRPIVRFSCHEVMLACPLGNNVKQKYLGFARSIDAFKDTIYKKWDKGVTSTVTEALTKTIIIESNGVWPSHDLTATGRFLTSNFSPQINQVIREAKYLSDLGLKIPDEALSVVFQEDTFNG